MVDNATAERAEEIRDLRNQIAGLQSQDNQEIVFQDTSRRPRKVTVYSMRDGRELKIPAHLLEQTLAKRDRDGSYLFTSRIEKAPEFRRGTIKCFLHPESDERALLNEIGLETKTCKMATMPNNYTKRQHAEHRHSSEWAVYQEARQRQERQESERRQQDQVDAMLKLAEGAAGKKAKAGSET